MGVSTDGQICFGVLVDEGEELPWNDEKYDGIEDWWLDVLGYKPPFPLYDEDGNYINGISPPEDKINEYYRHRSDFKKTSPSLPIELVNYCSNGYPIWILAIPSTCYYCHRGYPTEFEPEVLTYTQAEKDALLNFCQTYNIGHKEPKWWLSSYWG